MSCQLNDGEVASSYRPFDLVEAHPDGRRRGRSLATTGRHGGRGRRQHAAATSASSRCTLMTSDRGVQASIHKKPGSVQHRLADRSRHAGGRRLSANQTLPELKSSFAPIARFSRPALFASPRPYTIWSEGGAVPPMTSFHGENQVKMEACGRRRVAIFG